MLFSFYGICKKTHFVSFVLERYSKGSVQRFTQQVEIKCFLLNPEKNWYKFVAVVFEKNV